MYLYEPVYDGMMQVDNILQAYVIEAELEESKLCCVPQSEKKSYADIPVLPPLLKNGPFENVHANLHKYVTAVYSSHNRFSKVRDTIASVRKFYPEMPILILDDGRYEICYCDANVYYLKIPTNAGVSRSRNLAISMIKTPYVFLTDEDIQFTDSTNLTEMLRLLVSNDHLMMVAGAVDNRNTYAATITHIPKTPDYEVCQYDDAKHKRPYEGCHISHRGLMSYVGKMSMLKDYKWNATKVMGEHTQYFREIQQNATQYHYTRYIAICPHFMFHHHSGRNSMRYNKLRLQRANSHYFDVIHKCDYLNPWPKILYVGPSNSQFRDILSSYLHRHKKLKIARLVAGEINQVGNLNEYPLNIVDDARNYRFDNPQAEHQIFGARPIRIAEGFYSSKADIHVDSNNIKETMKLVNDELYSQGWNPDFGV